MTFQTYTRTEVTVQFTDPRDMPGAIKDIKPHPELIKKHPVESHSQYYERAEKQGIARLCVQCGAKRRFSMLQCAVCNSFMFHQVEHRAPSDPGEGEPKESMRPANQTEASGDGNYSFEGNPEYDPKSGGGDPEVKMADSRPLADRSLSDLKIFAAQKEITLPTSLRRKNASKAKVREFIEDALGGINADAMQTKAVDGPILDREGHEASRNQLSDPNEPS